MKINLKLKRRKKKEWVAGGWNWIYRKRIEHVEPVSGSWDCNKFIKIKQKKLWSQSSNISNVEAWEKKKPNPWDRYII